MNKTATHATRPRPPDKQAPSEARPHSREGSLVIPQYWLFGARADRGWFLWSLVVPLALYLPAYWALGAGVVWPLYVLYAACFATPHTWLTWAVTLPRTAHGMYAPRALWEPIGYTVLLAIGVPVTHRVGGWDLLFTIITMIGFYHVTKQHLGILRMYDAKYVQVHGDAGFRADMEPFHRLLVLLLAFPLFWVWHLPEFAIAIGPQSFTLLHPIIPGWALWVYGAGVAGCTGHAAWRIAARARAGKPFPACHFLLAGAASVSYAAAFFLVPTRDYLLTVAIFITYHDLQYAGFVWHFQRLRSQHEAARGTPLDAIHRWTRDNRYVPYFALAFGYSVAVFAVMMALPALLAMAFVTFQTMVHQIMDGWIWKRRYYPRLQAHLGLAEGAAS